MFTTTTNIQNSILTQTGTTAINVGGKLNLPATGTATATAGKNSQPRDFVASVFNSGTKTAVPQTFQLEAEPAGNNTSTASGTLNLLYASGTGAPAETGLSISNKGLITFAAGQAFPGTGPGTITGLTAGTDLTGGGTSGKVTLNLDTTKVPTLGAASNTFTGGITAASFTGNGAGLTSVNASQLGGIPSTNYARLDIPDVFNGSVSSTTSLVADWLLANSGGMSPGLELGQRAAITSTQTSGTNQFGMDFWTNSARQMSLTATGYLGVGTAQPYTNLHLSQKASGGLGPVLTLMNAGGAQAPAPLSISTPTTPQ